MWTKLYSTGETISEPNSWSRTTLDNMIGCTLIHRDLKVEIYGPGEYWQSDTYVANLEEGISGARLTKRRILKFIDNIHVGKILKSDDHSFSINFYVEVNKPTPSNLKLINVFPSWFVAEIDILSNKVSYYLSKNRI